MQVQSQMEISGWRPKLQAVYRSGGWLRWPGVPSLRRARGQVLPSSDSRVAPDTDEGQEAKYCQNAR